MMPTVTLGSNRKGGMMSFFSMLTNVDHIPIKPAYQPKQSDMHLN
jgi:hypothetical protein